MQCSQRRRVGAGRSVRCRCLDVLLCATLLGALAFAAVSLWERYAIQEALVEMKTNLDTMKKIVANTGQAYDELHEELDRLTSENIPKSFLMDRETNYGDDIQTAVRDSTTQSISTALQDNAAQSDATGLQDTGSQSTRYKNQIKKGSGRKTCLPKSNNAMPVKKIKNSKSYILENPCSLVDCVCGSSCDPVH